MSELDKITYADYAYAAQIKINVARQGQTTPEPVARKIALSESAVPYADTGVQKGDPYAGRQRRTADIDGSFERGTVKVPEFNPATKRTKLTDVPATEENVRKALDYWRARKPRKPESRARQNEMVSRLTRQLAAMSSADAPRWDKATERYTTRSRDVVSVEHNERTGSARAFVEPGVMFSGERGARMGGQRDHGSIDGVALVRGRSLAPEQPMRLNPATGEREVSSRGTMGLPLGRERLDSELREPRDKGRRSRTQSRRYRRKEQRARERGELDNLRRLHSGEPVREQRISSPGPASLVESAKLRELEQLMTTRPGLRDDATAQRVDHFRRQNGIG